MRSGLQDIKENNGYLYVQIDEHVKFDAFIYDQIRMDEECLQPIQKAKNCLRYEINGLISLSCFLESYVFEREEGYRFLIQLLEHCLKVNRNKPIVMDVRFIYLPPRGNFLRFVAVPLNVEHWYLQKEECRAFAKYLAMHFQTKEAYEIIGFLVRSTHGSEFSLTALLQGFLFLKGQYEEKIKFWQRARKKAEQQTFIAREQQLQNFQKQPAVNEQTKVEERWSEEVKTCQLGDEKGRYAWLEGEKDSYALRGEELDIGRAQDCAITISDLSVSDHHLHLRKERNRWYIRDLKSQNGTFLNGKRVQREMRLREGMVIQIAQFRLVFHEQSIST